MSAFIGISKRQLEKTRRRKPVIQSHHYSYKPGVSPVNVRKGEHEILTKLSRLGWVSKNFVECLKRWISENEKAGVEL
jgi:hypothetical protein